MSSRSLARVRRQGRRLKVERAESNPGVSLPLYRKLFLLAAVMGNEACVSFQQLYQIPLLLILGIPAPLVSLYPIICGPAAMLLMTTLGFYSDKGRNHQYRKIVVLAIDAVVTMGGISLVVVASVMFASINMLENNSTNVADDTNTSRGFAEDATSTAVSFNFTTLPLPQNSENLSFLTTTPVIDDLYSLTLPMLALHATTAANNNSAPKPLDPEGESSMFDVPLPAVLALLGFCLMDIGYDTLCASTRSCVLACSPRADHTSLLVLALVMAALGGCYTCALGLADLSHVFHLGNAEGSLVEQTTVQLLLCFLIMATTLTSTVIVSLLNIKYLNENHYTPLGNDDDYDPDHVHQGNAPEKRYGSFANDTERKEFVHGPNSSENVTEETVLWKQSSFAMEKPESLSKSHQSRSELTASTGINARDRYEREVTMYRSTDQFLFQDHGNVSPAPPSSNEDTSPGRVFCGWDSLKINFGIACCAAFFGTSVIFSYNMFVSEFLGRVVMGGDSSAPKGSPAFKAYESGVGLTSGGLLIFFCSYIAASVLQSKLLKNIGLRLDFCLSQMVMSGAILILVLSEEVAAFYVACVLYSFHRSALYTVPFVVAKSYVHEKDLGGKGGSDLGKVLAVMTCMIPLNYCTLFLLSGPLVYLTSNEGAPLLVASAAAFVSACVFVTYGRV